MKPFIKPVFWVMGMLSMVFLLLFSIQTPASAQTVTIESSIPDYDVLYLADYVDVTTQKLKSSIPDVSWTLTADKTLEVFLQVIAYVKLKDDTREDWVARAFTKKFTLPGVRIITANDISTTGKGGEIKIHQDAENKPKRDQIEDYAKKFPTAPVGQYRIVANVFDGKDWDLVRNNTDANCSGITPLGTKTIYITIRNASPDEVQVTLESPQDQEVIATTFPTFNWSAENPDSPAKISVYEMLAIHRSPQEATNGVPHLIAEVKGTNSFTYPTNAPRRLEQGKRYVWFVTKHVKTNRGNVKRESPIYRFRIATDDPLTRALEQFTSIVGGDLQATFQQLQAMGWTPTGQIILDGRSITGEEFKLLVERLVRENKVVTIKIE
jgi:hypothetical protein